MPLYPDRLATGKRHLPGKFPEIPQILRDRAHICPPAARLQRHGSQCRIRHKGACDLGRAIKREAGRRRVFRGGNRTRTDIQRKCIRVRRGLSEFLRNPFEHLARIYGAAPYIPFIRNDAVPLKRSSDMSKRILYASSLVFVLAMSVSMSANASSLTGNEEDLAAPHGSFTSDMAAPADFTAARLERRERFAMRFSDESRRMRQSMERQK
jgi:hypothetical protein